MKLEDFLSGYHKKILLANKVSVGNALIRKFNIQKGRPTVNIECMDVLQLAAGLVNGYLLKNSKDKKEIEILSSNAAKYILMNLLQEGSYESFKADYMTYDTVGEILNCINEIRLNGTTAVFFADCKKNSRLKDLNQLCQDYEKNLNDKYDEVKVIYFAIEILSKISKDELEFIFPLVNGMQMADLETNRWSCKEKEFVTALAEKLGIELKTVQWKQEEEQAVTYSIVKAYGIANEVQHIVNELVELKDEKNDTVDQEGRKKYRKWKKQAGNVAVYYSAPGYLNYIRAAFDAAGIPYVVEQGDSAAVIPLTNFYIDLLKSVKNDFSYADLENVVCNRCMTLKYEMSEGEKMEYPRTGYNRVLEDGIGWGRDRYENYYKQKKNDQEKDQKNRDKHFVEFLNEYIKVFDIEENKCASTLLEDLMALVKRYTYNQNPDKKQINGQIADKIRDLKYLKDEKWGDKNKKEAMMKRVDLLLEFFESMKIGSEEEENKVVIKKVDGIFVMERKYHYFLGMSTSAFTLPIRQSAIMPDDEKANYILGSKEPRSSVVIAQNKNKDRGDAVKAALDTLAEGEVHFLFSDYDTVNLREDRESVFISELKEELKGKFEEINADGYKDWDSYLSKDLYIDADQVIDVYKKYEIKDKKTGKQDAKQTDNRSGKQDAQQGNGQENNGYNGISATGMETLLGCPLRYYYSYVHNIKEREQLSPKGYMWLGPDKKGTLCHGVLEQYLQVEMPPKKEVAEAVQDDTLNEALDIQLQNMIKKNPCLSEDIISSEAEEYRKQLREYLERLHKEWVYDKEEKEKNWKVIECELAFGKKGKEPFIYESDIAFGDKQEKLGYRLELKGFIDRVDGYVDSDGCLQFRIIDYKTGRKENLEKKVVDKKTEVQHYIYAMELVEYIQNEENRKTLREDIFARDLSEKGLEDFTGYKIEKVAYVLPFLTGSDTVVDVTEKVEEVMVAKAGGTADAGKDLRNITIKLPDGVGSVGEKLDRFMGFLQNNKLDELAAYMDEAVEKGIKGYDEYYKDGLLKHKGTLEDFCGGNYCKYKDICRRHVGY